jgi:hypothetical protein
MLDDMFPFIDPIMEPTQEDLFHSVVQLLEQYFELVGADAMASLPVSLPERTKIDVPLDIALSLLRPDELEKLKNYVTSYLIKHNSSEAE